MNERSAAGTAVSTGAIDRLETGVDRDRLGCGNIARTTGLRNRDGRFTQRRRGTGRKDLLKFSRFLRVSA